VKVVICGSFGDMGSFLEVLEHFKQMYGEQNVFPNKEHLERSKSCIEAHHDYKGETDETLAKRSILMRSYFDHIEKADLVVIVNEKHGQEYYGVGTTVELGYAVAKGKPVRFTREPTNANALSLTKMQINQRQLCVTP
jgi:nucleoside 2-deoxyribosyltransferase